MQLREGGAFTGRGERSCLRINHDINLYYEYLKKAKVHAKEYTIRQGSLWCRLFL